MYKIISNLCCTWIKFLHTYDYVDLKKSKTLREKGNQYFTSNNYWEAIKKYTKSIFKSSDTKGNEEASKAHANRAAALFQMKFYEVRFISLKLPKLLNFLNSLNF